MNRHEKITFRVSSRERRLLVSLAHYYRRTRSDAIRFLLYEKAQELGLENNSHDLSNETQLSHERKIMRN